MSINSFSTWTGFKGNAYISCSRGFFIKREYDRDPKIIINKISKGEFLSIENKIKKLSLEIKKIGLRNGDRVLIISENNPYLENGDMNQDNIIDSDDIDLIVDAILFNE